LSVQHCHLTPPSISTTTNNDINDSTALGSIALLTSLTIIFFLLCLCHQVSLDKHDCLAPRWLQVSLPAPTVPDTVSILRGLRSRLERHHAVRISDAALAAAATLSERHIPDRCARLCSASEPSNHLFN
jgi:hypothetical protein